MTKKGEEGDKAGPGDGEQGYIANSVTHFCKIRFRTRARGRGARKMYLGTPLAVAYNQRSANDSEKRCAELAGFLGHRGG